MAIIHSSHIVLLLLFLVYLFPFIHADGDGDMDPGPGETFNRKSFPKDFIFGTSTSAYQYEGAAYQHGRGPSIWGNFTHEYPERIADGSNGDIAADFYDRYRGDLQRNKDLNMDALRFSISWSRILPNGTLKGGVNSDGIEFYNNLINDTVSKGLTPFVTLFHWDTPQDLDESYQSFLSDQIIYDYLDFVEVCFKAFGDRVKYWITLNEPWTYSAKGYNLGVFAPGRCSKWINNACQAGNSATEPYIVTHNLILAHAKAVDLYRKKYQDTQKGQIGITLVSFWFVPDMETLFDIQAQRRALDFMLGWYMDPLTTGQYPINMQRLVGERLPNFTAEESELIKGSYDFLGLNYYTAWFVKNGSPPVNISYSTDSRVIFNATNSAGELIGPQAGSTWLHIYPRGIKDLLMYVNKTYNPSSIYITENGMDDIKNRTLTFEERINDYTRIKYFRDHLQQVHEAINASVNVKGYFAWSLLNNFEWSEGYTSKFGLYHVDEKTLKRSPKKSASWFANFLK